MTGWRGSLEDFGHDLLNRQINLIVTKGGMTGRSAPPIRRALQQIASRYAKAEDLAPDEVTKINKLLAEPTSGESAIGELARYRAAFAKLKSVGDGQRDDLRAELADTSPSKEPSDAGVKRVKLRIADNTAVIADLLGGKVESLGDLSERQIATIQKIWEVGTDTIIMQTTISLSGDIVTRIHSEYTEQTALWQLHQQSVDASSASWKDLVEAAVQLFRGLFGQVQS